MIKPLPTKLSKKSYGNFEHPPYKQTPYFGQTEEISLLRYPQILFGEDKS